MNAPLTAAQLPVAHGPALVQGRDHLSAARQVVLRFQQRRHRRLSRPDLQARLHRRPRRQRDLAAAVLSLAAARRRLRHRRLPRRPSRLRHDGRRQALHREAHERGMRVITELVINHTSDQHPWFQRARRAKPGSRGARLLRLVRQRPEIRGHAHHLHRYRDDRTGPGTRWPRPTTGTASTRTSPTSISTIPRVLEGGARASCASGSTWASTGCGSTPCPIWSSAKAPTTRTCRRRTPC